MSGGDEPGQTPAQRRSAALFERQARALRENLRRRNQQRRNSEPAPGELPEQNPDAPPHDKRQN